MCSSDLVGLRMRWRSLHGCRAQDGCGSGRRVVSGGAPGRILAPAVDFSADPDDKNASQQYAVSAPIAALPRRFSTPTTKTCRWGPRLFTPATRTCRWGPRLFTPATKTCRWGPRLCLQDHISQESRGKTPRCVPEPPQRENAICAVTVVFRRSSADSTASLYTNEE